MLSNKGVFSVNNIFSACKNESFVHTALNFSSISLQNEDTRTGINEWKRGRLIVAGARAIAPDFSQPEELMQLLDYK